MFRKNHSFSAGQFDNNSLYFSDNGINGLFSIDMKSKKVTFLGQFEDEKPDSINLHRMCIKIDEKILFFPENAKCVHVYNLSSKSIDRIELNVEKTNWLADACMSNDKIYLFPHKISDAVLTIDLSTNSVYENITFNNNRNKIESYLSGKRAFTKAIEKNGHVYLPLFSTSLILDYDSENGLITLVNTEIKDICTIYSYDNGFLLYTNSNDIYYLDSKFSIISKINVPAISAGGLWFTHLLDVGSGFIAIPQKANNLYFFDRENWRSEIIPYPDSFKFYQNVNVKFWGYAKLDSDLFLFPQGSDSLLMIDCIQKKSSELIFPIPFNGFTEKPYNSIFNSRKRALLEKQLIQENVFLGPKDLIELIK